MPANPTVRSLARRLGLSVATVSEALRGVPRVSADTRERVQRHARKLGYQPNPLLGAALSAVRRARHRDYRGTLALIDTDEQPHRQHYVLFHREIATGAEARAQELGFRTELFLIGPHEPAVSTRRLPGILRARGIAGAVLLPFHTAQDFSDFDFSRLAAVQMDHCLIQPRLHTILPDHHLSLHASLTRLRSFGYRRIGLCLTTLKDTRIKHKWSAAYLAFHQAETGGRHLPLLLTPQLRRQEFLAWWRTHRPDAIVGHAQQMVAWLQEDGVRVPEEVGFFNLNLTERTGPCAGLDLEPRRLGALAVETVVGMLHRQERGVPARPHTLNLEASWVDGPTLRRAGA